MQQLHKNIQFQEKNMEFGEDNTPIKLFVAGLTISSLVILLVIYAFLLVRHRQTYWVSYNKSHMGTVDAKKHSKKFEKKLGVSEAMLRDFMQAVVDIFKKIKKIDKSAMFFLKIVLKAFVQIR